MNEDAPGLLVTILSFFAVVAPLIFVHELGHYFVGRWFGVKAEAFSIGFGREVAGWTDRRGTRWKLGWLPLGGYVKFSGDMSPASEPTDAWLALPAAQRNETFQSKTLWQKSLIVFAGPAVNFLVAVLIFAGFLAAFGDPRTPTRVAAVQPGSAAAVAGLRPGDVVRSLGGREVDTFDELRQYVVMRADQRVELIADRDGAPVRLPVTIGAREEVDRFGNVSRFGQIGLMPGPPVNVRLSPLEIPGAALRLTGSSLRMILDGLGQVITGRRPVKELGGPLKIAQYSGEQVSSGWLSFAWFVALISINLGFINLLPVPMLDGGHLLFYALTAIRRRPVSTRALEWSFRGGLALLLGLMLMTTFNDLASFGLFSALRGLLG